MKKGVLLIALLCMVVGGCFAQTKSKSVVSIGGKPYYIHAVQSGETLYSLGKLYGITNEEIISNNPQAAAGLQPDQLLKIPNTTTPIERSARQTQRQFDTHTVNQGETAYSIAKRYGISTTTLMEDNNGFDPTTLSIGQKILIRKGEIGKSNDTEIRAELEQYRETLDQVNGNFIHHVVIPGETLYALSRTYNTPIDSLKHYNITELSDGLKVGTVIKIPNHQKNTQTSPSIAAKSTQDPFQSNPTITYTEPVARKQVNPRTTIRVALMLPLSGNDNKTSPSFMAFYQGVLLALEELKSAGASAQLDLYNTQRSAQEVEQQLEEGNLDQADLIIGPVYDDSFSVVADFARKRGIVAVSPLSAIEKADNQMIYQLTPSAATKMDKLKGELSANNNVIVISSADDDAELKREINPLLPNNAHHLTYTKGMSSSRIEQVLSTDRENIIVVLPRQENAVEEVLARVSSLYNNIVARGQGHPIIKVIGSARWARFTYIDKTLYFKLNLRYVTVYHADRGNERVSQFDRKYVAAFGTPPSLSAYRGYDAVKLFVGGIMTYGNDFTRRLNDQTIPLLQSPYQFDQRTSSSKHENISWPLVTYRNDFTIEVQ